MLQSRNQLAQVTQAPELRCFWLIYVSVCEYITLKSFLPYQTDIFKLLKWQHLVSVVSAPFCSAGAIPKFSTGAFQETSTLSKAPVFYIFFVFTPSSHNLVTWLLIFVWLLWNWWWHNLTYNGLGGFEAHCKFFWLVFQALSKTCVNEIDNTKKKKQPHGHGLSFPSADTFF